MEFPTDNKGLAYVEDFDAVMGDFLQQNPLRYHPPSGLYYIFDNNRGCYNVLDDNQTTQTFPAVQLSAHCKREYSHSHDPGGSRYRGPSGIEWKTFCGTVPERRGKHPCK